MVKRLMGDEVAEQAEKDGQMNWQDKIYKMLPALGVILLFGLSIRLASEFSNSQIPIDMVRSSESYDLDEVEEEGEPGPSNPDGALRFRHLQLQDEKGFIPPDGLEKA